MTTTYKPGVHKFAVFTVCWTVLLFIAGALVTSKDAALSVPDWPKSFGTWFPSLRMLAGGAFFEHSHRVIAAGMGFLVLVLEIWLWKRDPRPWMRWFGVTAVGGVVAQAFLGGQVVRQLLHYWLPVIHASFAQIVFAAVLSIAVFTSKWWVSDQPQLEDRGTPWIHFLAFLNAAVLYLQVILGAGFRHKEIPIWPHMAGAMLVLGMVIWTAGALRKRFAQSRELSRVRILLHAIFGTQFLLGLGAYWSRLSTADAPQPMPVMGWLTVIHTVVGTMLIAAGTAALNHYIERESDRYMRRTALRPLPTGVLQPREALVFGVALAIAGAVDLYVAAGALASGLGIATCLSYLLAYTPLKKRTVWATFVGAFPGAIPPMIGWVAATGSLDRGAWLLFGILFLWQFPHFHAIAWMYREDYARAGIMMLPVVDREGTRTFRQIILYAVALVGVSLLPAILGLAGVMYFFGALVISTALVQVCLWAASNKTNARAKWLMHATVLHIPLLLGLMVYDKLPR